MADESTTNDAAPADDGEAGDALETPVDELLTPDAADAPDEHEGLWDGLREAMAIGDSRPGEGISDAALPWLDEVAPVDWAQTLIMLGVVVLSAILAHAFARTYLLWMVRTIARRVFRIWDQFLIERNVFRRLVPIFPALVVHGLIRFVPHVPEELIIFVQRLAVATMVLVTARGLGAMYSAINDIYTRFPVSAGRPIKGYLQVAKIFTYVFAVILMLATLMGQPLGYFLSALGAMTAVIMLIFRDTILSLVAGMQLVNNDLVRVGDWITMSQFDADGDVVDISLNVVKVRNFDRTVTVIPTHMFLEHSFTNWRSMFEDGGRRIRRSINIDMTTIRFLADDEIERFSRFVLLRDYIGGKIKELQAYNAEHCPEDASDILANARHLTNIGTFRAYISAYLRQHPQIHEEMTFLIRQLESSSHGVPLEIYVFTRETRWAYYEGIQSDIFDHLLAIIHEFGLRVYQEASGYDMTHIGDPATAPITRPKVPSNGHGEDN
ncbi:MAG: mechanosensitive ion channel domain-containing protein [Phycisphaeraceae bacterium]